MSKCNIVLFQPEIPSNTGNIARTCVGFNMKLHLIKPYGFSIDDKKIKRAGLDYWPLLKLFEYEDFEDFSQKNNLENVFIITKFGKMLLTETKLNFKKETYFIFGKETKGLPREIMDKYLKNSIKIPMQNIRSFNLSNVVAIVANHYEMSNNYFNLK